MMRTEAIRTTAWAVTLISGLTGTAPAQTDDLAKSAWVGVKVLPKENYVVKSGDEVVDSYDKPVLHLPWVVQDVNGPWLLVGGSRKGWVLRDQIVTLHEAHAYYTGLIQRDPANYWAYNLRGLLWMEEGDLDLAVADFNQVLQIDPSAVAYVNRGNAWQAMGEHQKAVADYSKAIQLDPKYVLAFVGRGMAWWSEEQNEKAIEDYNHALRLNPRYARAYNDRALVRQARKQFGEAVKDYEQAIQIDPNYASAYRDLAWLFATCPVDAQRDGKRAVEYATKACELTGWSIASYLDTLACAYAEAGDFDSAASHEQQAANLKSSDAEFVAAAKQRLQLFQRKQPYRE